MFFSLQLVGVLMVVLGSSKVVNAVYDGTKSELLTAENWPIDGPWIVEIENGQHDRVAKEALSVFKRYSKSIQSGKSFQVTTTIEDADVDAFNAVVVEGPHRADLEKLQGVRNVYPDLILTKLEYNWGTDRSDQLSLPLDKAFSPDFCGKGVDVYILDTGFDSLHQEFGGARKSENTWNGYGQITENTDKEGHGTHCAGSAVGSTVGIATCANVYGVKVLNDNGSGSTSKIIQGMNHVKKSHLKSVSKKTIISMSLGGDCEGSCAKDPLVKKVEELYKLGIITAAAAGNSAEDAKRSSPASAANAVTVGATRENDKLVNWSNYGPVVDIQAPGVNIVSACSSNVNTGECKNSDYVAFSGTSMACPHVAGALAMLMEKGNKPINSAATAGEVVASLLCDSAKDKVSHKRARTTKDLLQIPKDDGIWACSSDPVTSPVEAPVAPTCDGPFPGFNKCERKIKQFLKKPQWWFDKNKLDRTRCALQDYLAGLNKPLCPATSDCPGPFAGFPDCEDNLMLIKGYLEDNDILGSRCSIKEYLAETDVCPDE